MVSNPVRVLSGVLVDDGATDGHGELEEITEITKNHRNNRGESGQTWQSGFLRNSENLTRDSLDPMMRKPKINVDRLLSKMPIKRPFWFTEWPTSCLPHRRWILQRKDYPRILQETQLTTWKLHMALQKRNSPSPFHSTQNFALTS